jgi:hypothetical protein
MIDLLKKENYQENETFKESAASVKVMLALQNEDFSYFHQKRKCFCSLVEQILSRGLPPEVLKEQEDFIERLSSSTEESFLKDKALQLLCVLSLEELRKKMGLLFEVYKVIVLKYPGIFPPSQLLNSFTFEPLIHGAVVDMLWEHEKVKDFDNLLLILKGRFNQIYNLWLKSAENKQSLDNLKEEKKEEKK